MKRRILTSLVAAALLTFAGADALAAALNPPQPKTIAYVVAHAHPQTQAYVQRTHGL